MADDINNGFDLDAAWAEEQRTPFTFTWAGSRWTLPHLGDIDWRMVALADEMDLPAIQEVLRTGMGERAAEWEDTPQPAPAMLKLFDAWLEHSGMRPGEAPGSDGSSPSTEEPSPPISTASTASASAKPSSGRRKSGSRSGS
ncbi:hypothetical protein [Micromonospora sediminicola]|uniref:hypothetical protein n=1 Tax=Micromonospora sediminicola TaxID=946078 RepID=UPI0037A88263